jgi:uncharacterized protein YjbJ (UPF0337 family)
MSSTGDKAKGVADEVVGAARKGVGKAVGNERLEAKGAAQEVKGHAEKAVGDAKAAVKHGADKVAHEAHKKL